MEKYYIEVTFLSSLHPKSAEINLQKRKESKKEYKKEVNIENVRSMLWCKQAFQSWRWPKGIKVSSEREEQMETAQ